ncbi:hypothetical protein BTVI_27377 [Pitangus sulphuratus]|nr:hypothetical protein BTVI_27377 [Pitangus sulphuratus]
MDAGWLHLFLWVMLFSPYYKHPFEPILKFYPRAKKGLSAVLVLCIAIVICDVTLHVHQSNNNPAQSAGRTGKGYFLQLFHRGYSFRTCTRAFELPFSIMQSILVLLYLPSFLGTLYNALRAVVRTVFREIRGVFSRAFQALVPAVHNQEWQGRWEKIGQLLEDYFPAVLWKFTPEQVQDPDKMAEYLREKCRGNSREERLIALCWALASAYRALLDARQLPRGEGRTTISVATQTAAGALPGAAVPIPKKSKSKSAATQTDEPLLGALVPAQKKSKSKPGLLARDEEETGSSEEEEAGAALTLQCPCLGKLRHVRKYFRRQLNESVPAWLARCWAFGAQDITLDGREARNLGCLAWIVHIDKGIAKTAGPLSLWKRLLSSVKELYPAKNHLFVPRDVWWNLEEGVQYLRELAVLQVLYDEAGREEFPLDPGRAFCTFHTWHWLRESAPCRYSGTFPAIGWSARLTVNRLATRLCQYHQELSRLAGVKFLPLRSLSRNRDCYPCRACYEMLGKDMCELQCGHEFHRECVETAVLQISGICPVCRSPAFLAADIPELPRWNSCSTLKAKVWMK